MPILVFAVVAASAIFLLLLGWLCTCLRERRTLRQSAEREARAAASRAEAVEAGLAPGQRAVFVDGVYMYTIPANPDGAGRAGGGPTRIPASAVVARLDKVAPSRPLTACPACTAASEAEPAAEPRVSSSTRATGEGQCGKNGTFCQSCSVCLDPFTKGDMARKLPCGHIFHSHCISKWVQRANRCPLCQHEIVPLSEAAEEMRATQQRGAGSAGTSNARVESREDSLTSSPPRAPSSTGTPPSQVNRNEWPARVYSSPLAFGPGVFYG